MSTCVDSLSLALGQISFAVNDLTKKNYKATLKEIHEVSVRYNTTQTPVFYASLMSVGITCFLNTPR